MAFLLLDWKPFGAENSDSDFSLFNLIASLPLAILLAKLASKIWFSSMDPAARVSFNRGSDLLLLERPDLSEFCENILESLRPCSFGFLFSVFLLLVTKFLSSRHPGLLLMDGIGSDTSTSPSLFSNSYLLANGSTYEWALEMMSWLELGSS